MTTSPGGGTKRSSWLTFRRRLLLVRTLLRAPATSAELIAAINAELGEQGYPEAAAAALKHDFDALKGEYGCVITYDRPNRLYHLADLGELALLDLPDPFLEALAFLEASFPEGSGLPEHANLRALLERVVLLLPPEQGTPKARHVWVPVSGANAHRRADGGRNGCRDPRVDLLEGWQGIRCRGNALCGG